MYHRQSAGTYKHSFVSNLLQKIEPEKLWLNETLIRDAAATAFGGMVYSSFDPWAC